MVLQERDKKALVVAVAAVALYLLFQFVLFPLWDRWQQEGDNLALQERTLLKYRQAVEAAGARSTEGSSLETRLKEEEAGLLASGTAALASAELQELVKQLTEAQSIAVGSSNFLPTRPLGENYVQVPLGLQFQCQLDQLVNFMQGVAESPKSLAVGRLQIQATGTQEKLIRVNMTVTGVMRSAAVVGNSEEGAGG